MTTRSRRCALATVVVAIANTGAPELADGQIDGEQRRTRLDSERSELVQLDVIPGRIMGRAYLGDELGAGSCPVLLLVLHGDLLEPDNSYHYGFARTIASQTPNVVAVGLLRSGYVDERGNRSDGDALTATGDNYTSEVVEAVARATGQLNASYGTSSTILVGHSGGAAIAALVMGRHPAVADAALLAACPCDLPAWRSHMMSTRQNAVWEQPHRGLSPMDYTDGVRSSAVVELMSGENDEIALPEYSRRYATALRAKGVDARVSILPGLGHNILHSRPVIEMTSKLISSVASGG